MTEEFDAIDAIDVSFQRTRTLTIDVNEGTGFVGVSLSDAPDSVGVIVTHVHPRDQAAHAGLRMGDVVREHARPSPRAARPLPLPPPK